MRKYPTIDVKKTGERIKSLCKCKGITVKEIQEYMGLECFQTIYNWLSGKSLPSIDNLVLLCRLLERSMDSIIYVSEDEQ